MVLSYLLTRFSILPRLFHPTTTALFSPIPFTHRWRLLLLQPLNILAFLLTSPSILSIQYTIIFTPTRSGPKRCLVFQPPRAASDTAPRPLHIDFHGGGFTGGFAEQDARWCELLAKQTGAVVVSGEYRLAPQFVYPAAHEDVEDMISYFVAHAEYFGADRDLVTIGGSSAGATLGLGACLRLTPGMVKAWVGFCAPVDLRTRPKDKIKPSGFPKFDPVAFLDPLFDAYAGTEREGNWEDERCHPTLARSEDLPESLLFVCAGIDILLHEQMMMIERLGRERKDRGVEVLVVEKGWHGFVELPSWIMEEERLEVFAKAIGFVKAVHTKHGFEFNHERQRAM